MLLIKFPDSMLEEDARYASAVEREPIVSQFIAEGPRA